MKKNQYTILQKNIIYVCCIILLTSCSKDTIIFPDNCKVNKVIYKGNINYYNYVGTTISSTISSKSNNNIYYYSLKDTLFIKITYYPFIKSITKYYWNEDKTGIIIQHKDVDSTVFINFTAKVENNKITIFPRLFSNTIGDTIFMTYNGNKLATETDQLFIYEYEYFNTIDSIGYANKTNGFVDRAIIDFFKLSNEFYLLKKITIKHKNSGIVKETTNYNYIRDAKGYIKFRTSENNGSIDTAEFIYSCDF